MKPVELDLDAIPKRARKSAEPVKAPTRKHAAWRRIVRSLRVDGPQTMKALSANLGISMPHVEYIIGYYLRHAMVERVGRRYKLAEKYADLGKPRPRRTPKPAQPKPNAWTKIAGDDD